METGADLTSDNAGARASAELQHLAALQEALVSREPRSSRRRTVAMAALLAGGIAVGALHSAVLGIIALPFILYAMVSLSGVDDWRKIGVVPRRPRGPVAVVVALYLAAVVPGCWLAGSLLDDQGHRWALPVAGVLAALLMVGGRIGSKSLLRASLRPR